MAATATGFTGVQKAAMVLLQMDTEQSAAVMRHLSDAEAAEISYEIARLQAIEADAVDEVVKEFHGRVNASVRAMTGGFDKARSLLESSVGEERARAILNSSAIGHVPFSFLRRTDPVQVLGFLRDEHPQTIALVLAHMMPDQAAMVISGLDEAQQRDVAHRLAVMEPTPPEAIGQVHRQLEKKLASVIQPNSLATAGGVQVLVDILNQSDRNTEKQILEGLNGADPSLAEEIRARMFVFRDIVTLDDRSIQLVLRGVDSKDLAMALKGVATDVREKITKNMSERAALNLLEEIDMLGPVRIKGVEEAQASIVRVIRSLEESGQLVLSRGGDEFVV